MYTVQGEAASLVQCSHCYEVMTRQQLGIHIQQLRAAGGQHR